MKKIKLMAVLMLCLTALGSCIDHDNEYAPEYGDEGMPKFGRVDMKPSRVITSDDAVSVTVDITCFFGMRGAQLYYWLNDNVEKPVSTKTQWFKGLEDKAVTFKGDKIIPKQKAGTKVTFQIAAESAYGMRNLTDPISYEVAEPEPAPEK